MNMTAFAVTHIPTELAVCPRLDGPPLRFNGKVLTRHQGPTTCPDGAEVFVMLWQRQTGEYTIALSSWTKEGWRPDAVKVDTLEDAMCELEAICAALHTAPAPPLPPEALPLEHTLEHLQNLARHAQDIVSFQTLAGHALSAWSDLSARAA